MKVIDLLNTPLDKLPKKIKVENKTYTLYINDVNQHYYQDDSCRYFMFSISCFDELNEKVEIIEKEKGIPEPIKTKIGYGGLTYLEDENFSDGINGFNHREDVIVNKITEIIDYLKSKEGSSNE